MSKYTKIFRTLLALVLVLASVLPYGASVWAAQDDSEALTEEYISEDEAQEIIDNADYVIDIDGNYDFPEFDEDYVEQAATLEEQANLYLYGTTPQKKPETKVANYTDYVFLSFEIGSDARNFNWQIVSNTTKGTKTYFSNDYRSRHAGYYSGKNTGLFIPVTNTSTGKNLLKKYKPKSGDIAQVRFHMSENTSEGIKSGGTTEVSSFFTFWSSANTNNNYANGTGAQNIKLTTSTQTVTFNVSSAQIGAELYGVRWDPYQTPSSDTDGWATDVRIYTHYIYVGPKAYQPVLVQYTNSSGTNLTRDKVYDDLSADPGDGYTPTPEGYIGYGQTAFAWPNDGLSTTNSDGSKTIWGWEIFEKNSSGTWTNTYEFIVDPTTHVCTVDTQFRQKSVTIPVMELGSKQEYTTGDTQAEKDDDRYVISVDAFDTMEIDNGSYGKPVDYAILMDRSGSMDELVSSKAFYAYTSGDNVSKNGTNSDGTTIQDYLKTLDKTKWAGYYRVTGWTQNKSSDNTTAGKKNWENYVYTMPLRYNRKTTKNSDSAEASGDWEVLYLDDDCNCNGTYSSTVALSRYGVYTWNSSNLNYCKHTKWMSVEDAFDLYVQYKKNTANNISGESGWNSAYFRIGVSRIGKQQEAVETLLNKIYASNAYLSKNTYNTVSIISYGHTVFLDGYPYWNQDGYCDENDDWDYDYPMRKKFKILNGLKETSTGASVVCSAKSVALHYANYDQIMNIVRSNYVFGQTRIDCAVRLLSNNQSYIEQHYYKGTSNESAHALTHTDYLPAKNSARNRVVIAMSDGLPTWYSKSDFEYRSANSAVKGALTLKNASVKIYGVGMSDDYTNSLTFATSYHAGSDNLAGKNNNFMLLLSSQYPAAKLFPKDSSESTTANAGSKNTDGKTYFYNCSKSASTLATVLGSIYSAEMPELKPTGKSGEASLWLYEEFRREWKLDTTPGEAIKIYCRPYNSNGTFSNPVLIGKHPIVTVAEDGTKTVHLDSSKSYELQGNGYILHLAPTDDQGFTATLQWTDAKKAFLRTTSWDTGYEATRVSDGQRVSASRGYKIVMEIPLEVNRDNTMGGNNIDLTIGNEESLTEGSGCYKANGKADTARGEKLYNYVQPNANVRFAVGSECYDYFMTMEEYIRLHSGASTLAGESNPVIDAYNNMIRVDADMKLTNSAGRSNLDYLSFNVQLLDEDGNTVVHRQADKGAQDWAANEDNRTSLLSLLKEDTSFTGSLNLTYATHEVDSFQRPPYEDVNEELDPNLYVPKFVVVDFDAEATVDLQKEAALVTDSTLLGANGEFDLTAATAKYNFKQDYDNADETKHFLEGMETIPYTVEANNPTKDGETTIDRNVYILPANVVNYDETLFDFYTVEGETLWTPVSETYTETVQDAKNDEVHGYDKDFAKTGDYHGNSMMTTVSKENPVANLASFEFFGTGFELLSRTAPETGAIIVEVFKAKEDGSYGAVADTGYLVDTWLSTQTLYQVPIVQFLGDATPANYKVNIIGFYDVAFDHDAKSRTVMTEEKARELLGYDEDFDFHYITFDNADMSKRDTNTASTREYALYVDGCRVFNSLPADEAGIRDYVYSLAGEKDANIININTQIVDATSKVDWSGSKENLGILYIAAIGDSTGSDGEINTTDHGFCLGMDGALNDIADESDKNKFYVLDSNNANILHPDHNSAIYYRKQESGTISFYCTDADGAEIALTDAEVRQYVGNGERVVYYGSKYRAIGPENEVYLAKDQGVAFTVNKANDKIFLGLKTNGVASMEIWSETAQDFVPFEPVTDYTSDTTMYFDISDYGPDIIIKNVGDGILSLCNIKCAAIDGDVAPVTVSTMLIAKATLAMNAETELPAEPIYDSALVFGHSLTLENDISVNFIGKGEQLDDYDSFYLECKLPVYNGNELVGYETVNIEPEYNGVNYVFTLTGITAKQMNDEIEAIFRLTKDDQEYYSKTDVYSVAEYAYGKLNSTKESDTAELKAICANLLRYGALAQMQFGYRTDALVDASMTDANKAYLTDLETVELNSYMKMVDDHDAPTVPWKSATLELGNKVIMCLIANLSNYAGDPTALTMRLSYVDSKGETVNVERALELYNEEKGYYAVCFDGLRATEMRSIVSAAIYEGETRVSKTVEYSIESYAARNVSDLTRAMLAYGDSAYAFFAN